MFWSVGIQQSQGFLVVCNWVIKEQILEKEDRESYQVVVIYKSLVFSFLLELVCLRKLVCNLVRFKVII